MTQKRKKQQPGKTKESKLEARDSRWKKKEGKLKPLSTVLCRIILVSEMEALLVPSVCLSHSLKRQYHQK